MLRHSDQRFFAPYDIITLSDDSSSVKWTVGSVVQRRNHIVYLIIVTGDGSQSKSIAFDNPKILRTGSWRSGSKDEKDKAELFVGRALAKFEDEKNSASRQPVQSSHNEDVPKKRHRPPMATFKRYAKKRSARRYKRTQSEQHNQPQQELQSPPSSSDQQQLVDVRHDDVVVQHPQAQVLIQPMHQPQSLFQSTVGAGIFSGPAVNRLIMFDFMAENHELALRNARLEGFFAGQQQQQHQNQNNIVQGSQQHQQQQQQQHQHCDCVKPTMR